VSGTSLSVSCGREREGEEDDMISRGRRNETCWKTTPARLVVLVVSSTTSAAFRLALVAESTHNPMRVWVHFSTDF
jgi:hypothetical protein